jgi:hypothetical protein
VDVDEDCWRSNWAAVLGVPDLGSNPAGLSFSVRAKAQALVTNGLHSRIRNPIYVFGALTIAGILLFIAVPKLLWILGVQVPLQIYRARNEEKVLTAKFGDEFLYAKCRRAQTSIPNRRILCKLFPSCDLHLCKRCIRANR